MSSIRIGEIEAKPGTKVSGFLPVKGLDMPDGSGNFWNIPVIIVNGMKEGPVFEVDGCIHGEEQLGAYTVLSLAQRLNPAKLKGTFIGVPVLNAPGFRTLAGVRGFMTDGYYVDMNRQFPGQASSVSATVKAAHTFWSEIIKKCNYQVNLHGVPRKEGPFVVYREDMEKTLDMAKAIAWNDSWFIACRSIHTTLGEHTVAWAAAQEGIATVYVEYGTSHYDAESLQSLSNNVVDGIENCMKKLDIIEGQATVPKSWRLTESYTHVLANRAGIIYPEPCLRLGNMVKKGELLCKVTDFVGKEIDQVRAPHDGIILCEPSRVSVIGYQEYGAITLVGTPPISLK